MVERPLLRLLVLGSLALVALAPAASAYHEPATKAPAVDPKDRAFYQAGADCLKEMGVRYASIQRSTSTREYVATAGQLETSGKACARKMSSAKPGTARGKRAKKPAVQAFTFHAKAGSAIKAAFLAGAAGKRTRADQLLGLAERHRKEADRLLTRSDDILRGQV